MKKFIQHYMKKIALTSFISLLIVTALPALADEAEDDALAKAQAQMNAEVLSKPFLAEKPEEVDAYIKSMLEKKAVPPEYQGTHWRAGYTCRDLLRYNWREYRNCRYYHRYHGRYYY